jgi:hypothetical protein
MSSLEQSETYQLGARNGCGTSPNACCPISDLGSNVKCRHIRVISTSISFNRTYIVNQCMQRWA